MIRAHNEIEITIQRIGGTRFVMLTAGALRLQLTASEAMKLIDIMLRAAVMIENDEPSGDAGDVA